MNSFIDQYKDELCKVTNIPQEAQDLEIPRLFLDETISVSPSSSSIVEPNLSFILMKSEF
jgi:hypothetical protein